MSALVWALTTFVFMIVVHVVVWRIRRPVGQYVGLLLLCGLVLIVVLSGLLLLSAGLPHGAWPLPQNAMDYLSLAFLYGVLSLSYISTYSCVQADSPSF